MTARDADRRHVLVVADGDLPDRAALDAAWPGWDDGAVEVIAADGGFARAGRLGVAPDVLVGDLDSLDASLAADAGRRGVEVLRADAAKDESDTELALLESVRRGARRVTILGALGGPRLDHALANVWLLAHPALRGIEAVLLDDRTRVSAVTAPGPDGGPVSRRLPGPIGGSVTLLPMGGDATGITTVGLRYPLAGEALIVGPARGLSNVRERDDAAVSLDRGTLIVVETAPTASGLSSGA